MTMSRLEAVLAGINTQAAAAQGKLDQAAEFAAPASSTANATRPRAAALATANGPEISVHLAHPRAVGAGSFLAVLASAVSKT